VQDVEDEPLFTERVAGLDIAKAEVEVTIRVPSDTGTGRRQQETRAFGTTRRELLALADWLRCWGVTKIGMEGTGVIRGRQRASATGGDGPLCSFLLLSRTVAWGPSATQTADRGADPATTSRRCRFCPFLADASATARPGPCPISSHLRPG